MMGPPTSACAESELSRYQREAHVEAINLVVRSNKALELTPVNVAKIHLDVCLSRVAGTVLVSLGAAQLARSAGYSQQYSSCIQE